MKLFDIKQDASNALNYMERLVNNGSRSGFTEKNSTSSSTNPFFVDAFNLIEYKSEIKSFGVVPKTLQSIDGLLLHPDWAKHIEKQDNIKTTDFRVCPTSSFRTVKLYEENFYLKLSYPGVIGRLRRDLQEKHIISCIQMSEILDGLIENPSMPVQFSFLPERGGCLGYVTSTIETGFMIRNSMPIGKNVSCIANIIPAFSLFGKDRKNEKDLPLLQQIIEQKRNGNIYLLTQYIYPLVDIYFTCLLHEGLSPEMHSQNILFGYDDEWNVVSIILRDLESIDKDISIREKLNKSKFVNSYKTIRDSDYNYLIKHSFMFDHKLGEYLVEELIECVANCDNINEATLCGDIKNYVKDKYGVYFKDLITSDGKWYKFENVEINHDIAYRPYLALDNSVFR